MITYKRVKFPRRATVNIEQKGMEIQGCRASSPGMPVRKNTDGSEPVPLEPDRLPCRSILCKFHNNVCPVNKT